MNTRLALFGALVLSTGCVSHPVTPRDPVTESSSVTVALLQDLGDGLKSVCSGVWISREYILTANHCTIGDEKDDSTPLVEMQYVADPVSQVSRKSVVEYRDTHHDLALLHAMTWPSHNHALVAKVTPSIGSTVHVAGHPMNMLWTYLVGQIAQYRIDLPGFDVGPFLQVQVPIANGSSGGGCFDNEGKLVGIADAVTSRLPGEGLFIPVESIRAFLSASVGIK